MLRAATWGAIIAVVLIAVGAALVATDVVQLNVQPEVPERVLVICTAPDEEGSEQAAVAFVMHAGDVTPELLNVDATVTVPGTSAQTPRAAYPFGGGAAVAKALEDQTGEQLAWVAVPSSEWEDLVEDAGGMEIVVPDAVRVYRDGELVQLEPGRQRVSGGQAVALASAVPFLSDQQRVLLARSVGSALSAVFTDLGADLATLVEKGAADSSMGPAELSSFFGDG